MQDEFSQVLADFHYDLAKNKIANQPLSERDQSKLLFFDRQSGQFSDYHFFQLDQFLNQHDVLVLNESKVFPARLLGKKDTGGKVELLLLKQLSKNSWQAISKPSLKLHQHLFFPPRNFDSDENFVLEDFLQGEVINRQQESALVEIEFNCADESLWQQIENCGYTPLPPYIKNQQSEDLRRSEYQTIYAKNIGSAAAPTAGLHFTEQLIKKVKDKGVQIEKIDLAVGLGTFAKLSRDNWQKQTLHREYFQISDDVAERLTEAKKTGKRIVAVGTTTTRALESALINYEKMQKNSAKNKKNSFNIKSGQQSTNLFIHPPFQFQIVDALITNFHLPESSLLMMLSAFTSQPNSPFVFEKFCQSPIGQAYQHAIENDYRFFSFGDAMLIV
jgi:S-adenosylmethionine:tRNA ribosyltransferase-isomerase